MKAALGSDGPDRPASGWAMSTANQHAAGGSTTVYLDPNRSTTIPLSQTSLAAGYCRTLFLDIWPRAQAA